METANLLISLPRFDGPLDLLLSLVRSSQYPVNQLPIAELTRQFLAHLRQALSADMDLGADFLDTASWLILLKSRSLLPQAPDEEAPQDELRRVVLDYTAWQEAARWLGEPGATGSSESRGYSDRGSVDSERAPLPEAPPSLQDLLDAARRGIEAARAAKALGGNSQESLTLEDRVAWVRDRLGLLAPGLPLRADTWFAEQGSVEARSLLFLALLELAREGEILIHQRTEFGPIQVKTTVTHASIPIPDLHPSCR